MDRFLEMDLTWFDPDSDLAPQIEILVERIAPLLHGVEGWRGIFFNVGWLIDLVTEWTGDPAQPIPTLSRRTAKWAARSYADLRDFVAAFRATAVRHELADLKVAVLFVGWAHVVWPPELKIYDFDSSWYARHPELYGEAHTIIGMPDLHPINRLHADSYPYAAFPNGLSEGAYFPEFFGAQWGSFADFTGFDALLLRDGLTGPMVYTRNGPYGTSAPADPDIVAAFSQSVRDLYRAVKLANPSKLIFGYSSAISPVADWRVGCVDFEALVADGYIDGWIEQTWGGAWQDWWHQLWKGWTFQTANLLTRGAMIARANEMRATPCKFYNLIETWDGWEPWDTLHQVPDKLRWAIWAFSHAAVLAPSAAEDYPVVVRLRDEFGSVGSVASTIPIDIIVIKEGNNYRIENSRVFFKDFTSDYNNVPASLSRQNSLRLDQLAEKLKKYPEHNIMIVGHAVMMNWNDSEMGRIEQEEILIPLSKARAESIKKAMVERGVKADKISTEGVGAATQLVPDSDYANRWKNRRTAIFIVK